MKKTIAIILALLIVLGSALTVWADNSVVEAEDALPFFTTIEDDFEGGILIVYIKKEYSYPNRFWCMDDFGVDEYIASYVDLTATSDENVLASYLGNP
ncbi:MAG: hypothetical protein IKU10_04530, partial [Clostridia bacterium]|nr:hypothetical protein [Clostridia bacterium]